MGLRIDAEIDDGLEEPACNMDVIGIILLTMAFDEIDLRILEVLQRDGRISNQDLQIKLACRPPLACAE